MQQARLSPADKASASMSLRASLGARVARGFRRLFGATADPEPGGPAEAAPLPREWSEHELLELLVREAARLWRYKHSSGALLLVELDGWSTLRLQAGRDAALLQQLHRTLQAQLRQSDSLSPMSQGQYACYLPFTDALGAVDAGERLRAAVQGLRGGAQKLSASVGVAVWPPAHDPLLLVPESNRAQAQLLWMQAQQSLALARSAGRNCVRLVSDAPLPGPQRHSGTRSA